MGTASGRRLGGEAAIGLSENEPRLGQCMERRAPARACTRMTHLVGWGGVGHGPGRTAAPDRRASTLGHATSVSGRARAGDRPESRVFAAQRPPRAEHSVHRCSPAAPVSSPHSDMGHRPVEFGVVVLESNVCSAALSTAIIRPRPTPFSGGPDSRWLGPAGPSRRHRRTTGRA